MAANPQESPARQAAPEAQEDIRIARIRCKDLVQFAEEFLEKAEPGTFLPITPQRATAHAHNPLVSRDDIGLLVAYHGDELVGFFGIMPILLKNEEEYSRVHWFTTWRVSPRLRGRSIGALLMREALDLGYDYLIVGSSSARRVCQKFGFLEGAPLEYRVLDLSGMDRLNPAVWLFRLFRKLLKPLGVKVSLPNAFTEGVARVIRPVTRRLFTGALWRLYGSRLDEVECRQVERVRPETAEQRANTPRVCLYRGPQAVNWMLQYPWVLESGRSASEGMDYFFTDTRPLHCTWAVELWSKAKSDIQEAGEAKYLGYVVFSASAVQGQVTVRVLDTLWGDAGATKYVLPLALRIARDYWADQVILSGQQASSLGLGFLRRTLLHSKQRIYQAFPREAGSPLGRAWPEIAFDYSDGDMAFS